MDSAAEPQNRVGLSIDAAYVSLYLFGMKTPDDLSDHIASYTSVATGELRGHHFCFAVWNDLVC